jgi:hypothetical protein
MTSTIFPVTKILASASMAIAFAGCRQRIPDHIHLFYPFKFTAGIQFRNIDVLSTKRIQVINSRSWIKIDPILKKTGSINISGSICDRGLFLLHQQGLFLPFALPTQSLRFGHTT